MPTHRHSLARRLVALLGTVALVVACTPTPSASPSPTPSPTPGPTLPPPTPTGSTAPAAEVYGEIRDAVSAIRGLQPTADVDPVTIDGDQLRTNLEAEFDQENRAEDLRFSEESLILLGLLPPGSSLRALTLDFQGGQVAGYYSPDKKELYVVSRSGRVGAAEEVTYAHEFTHQLTDQRFDLSKFAVDATNQSDRTLAQLALIEGDAVSVQTTWMLQNLSSEQMGELLAASLDPEALAALQRAPAYLRETALFPYQNGQAFVTGLLSSGGYDAIDAAYVDPPASTEQVLHPRKYALREAPVEVNLPADLATTVGAGWTEAGQDTLGEFILRLWLTQHGASLGVATAAAAGWGGDRLVLLRGPSGALTVGIRTVWDTAADADEFSGAARTAAASLAAAHVVRHHEGSKVVVVAVGDAADALAGALAG
jgi:hypothetical protein